MGSQRGCVEELLDATWSLLCSLRRVLSACVAGQEGATHGPSGAQGWQARARGRQPGSQGHSRRDGVWVR